MNKKLDDKLNNLKVYVEGFPPETTPI